MSKWAISIYCWTCAEDAKFLLAIPYKGEVACPQCKSVLIKDFDFSDAKFTNPFSTGAKNADIGKIPPIQPNPDAIKWAPGQEPMFNADRKLEAVREQSRKHNMSEHRKIVAAAPAHGANPKSPVAKAISKQKKQLEQLIAESREPCEHFWATRVHNKMSIRYCRLCNAFDFEHQREELDRAHSDGYAQAEKDFIAWLEDNIIRTMETGPEYAQAYQYAKGCISCGDHRKQDAD